MATCLTSAIAQTPAYKFANVPIVGGGYVNGIYYTGQSGIVYARTDIGGAYRSTNGGVSWTPITDFLQAVGTATTGDGGMDTEGFAVDPNSNKYNSIFLAVGQDDTAGHTNTGRLWYSTTGGLDSNGNPARSAFSLAKFASTNTVFSFIAAGGGNGRDAGERLVVDPGNSANVIFGTRSNGIWYSSDAGATWSQATIDAGSGFGTTTNLPADATGYGVVFVTPGTLTGRSGARVWYAGVSTATNGNSIYVSVDGGHTWDPISDPRTTIPPAHTSNPTRGLFGPDGNLYVIYNNVYTPATCNPSQTTCTHTGPDFVTYGRIYRLVPPTDQTNSANFASDTNWTDISPPSSNTGFGSIAINATQAPYLILASTLNGNTDVSIFANNLATVTTSSAWVILPFKNEITDTTQTNASNSPWLLFGATAQASGLPNFTGNGSWATSLAIDPTNSQPVTSGYNILYGTGATVFGTSNWTGSAPHSNPAQLWDHTANPPTKILSSFPSNEYWYINAVGLEETEVSTLTAITPGQTKLLSGVFDWGGFTHSSISGGGFLTSGYSPCGGFFENPSMYRVTSMDFSEKSPAIMVRSGYQSYGYTSSIYGKDQHGICGTKKDPTQPTYSLSPFAAYSTSNGQTWIPLPALSGVTQGGGSIAISQDGYTILWSPQDNIQAAWMNTTMSMPSSTWTNIPISGITAHRFVSDRVAAATFYTNFPPGKGPNGGAVLDILTVPGGNITNATPYTFEQDYSNTATKVPAGFLYTGFANSGDLWLATTTPNSGFPAAQTYGLYHSAACSPSTDLNMGGHTCQLLPVAPTGTSTQTVTSVKALAFGKTSSGTGEIVYIYGTLYDSNSGGSTTGIFKSTTTGNTWSKVDDANHQWGQSVTCLAGDRQYTGTIYICTGGRGIVEGDPN